MTSIGCEEKNLIEVFQLLVEHNAYLQNCIVTTAIQNLGNILGLTLGIIQLLVEHNLIEQDRVIKMAIRELSNILGLEAP